MEHVIKSRKLGHMTIAVAQVRKNNGLMLCPSKEQAEQVSKQFNIKTGYYVERDDIPPGCEHLVPKMKLVTVEPT